MPKNPQSKRKPRKPANRIPGIQKMNTDQLTLYSEINSAVEVLGTGALEIAVYDMHYLHPVVLVITKNIETPGHMAEIIIQAKVPDKLGRKRSAMNKGPAQELLTLFTTKAVNVMHGLTRQGMADLCGLTIYDMRLDWYCRTISRACLSALHLEVGWYQGRFRVLTARQVRAKETRIAKNNILGGSKRAERRLGVQTGEKYQATGKLSVQASLFDGAVEAEDALSIQVRDASD